MELQANAIREKLKEPMNAVFLVPLTGDDVGAMMIKSVDEGDCPMVIAKEYSGNERCLSWQTVCEQYEVVTG